MTMTRRIGIGGIVALAAIGFGGCAGPLNTSTTVGHGPDAWTPPAIGQSDMPGPETAAMAPTTDQLHAPVYGVGEQIAGVTAGQSIANLDRNGWESTPVNVPDSMPDHQPRFTNNLYVRTDAPRDNGLYPTPGSALDTATTASNEDAVKEAFIAPFAAGFDVVLFIPRFIAESRPRRPTLTGSEPYQRVPPAPVTIVQPPVTVVGTPRAIYAPPPKLTPAETLDEPKMLP